MSATVELPDLFINYCREKILPVLPRERGHYIVIDGRDGLGKSTIANSLYLANLSWFYILISLDAYLNEGEGNYFSALDIERIRQTLSSASNDFGGIIIEGCFAFKLVSLLNLQPQFRIFISEETSKVSQISGNHRNRPRPGLAQELSQYIRQEDPESTADLIIKRRLEV